MTTASNVQKQQLSGTNEVQSQEALIALQNEQLKHSKIKFLNTLQPDADTIFGMKNKPRQEEPSMKQIFTWGYEAPNKGDFIKDDTQQLRHKIRKMDREYISEVKDNYRKPEFSPEKGIYLFNFLDEESQEKWRKIIYERAVENESEFVKQSTYKQLFCGDDNKWWQEILQQVTPAGKPCYKDKPNQLITPQEFIKKKMEEKLMEIILKSRHQEANNGGEDGVLSDRNGQPMVYNEATGQYQPQKQFKIEEEQQAEKERKELARKERLAKKRAMSAKHQRQVNKRLNEIKSTSRWLPDSGITTYFGKPAFHPYGNGNTNPTVGGPVYGQYLKSHNINPQSGDNKPEHKQVFGRAMLGAQIQVTVNGQKSVTKGVREPQLPRKVREDIRLTPSEVDEVKARNPIMPDKYDLNEKEHVEIIKPDLTKARYLNSKHTTPADSASVSQIAQKDIPKANQIEDINKQYQMMQQQQQQNDLFKSFKPQSDALQSGLPIGQSFQQKQNEMVQVYKNQASHLDGFTSNIKQTQNQEHSLLKQDQQILKEIANKHQNTSKQQQVSIQSPTNANQSQKLGQQSVQQQQSQPPHDHSQCQVKQNLSTQQENLPFAQQSIPFCPVHGLADQPEFLHLLDPKNYKFLPHTYTQVIRPAGKFTHKSESISGLLREEEQ